MIHLLISIFGILLTIFFVIGTHEFAHFVTARWLGVKVLRFSIGFGKPLRKWYDKKGTEYVLAPIPLGGYVKMLDETEERVSKEEKHLAFNRQPFYKKFLIVAAGPVMNIGCAFILYWLVFVIGFVTVKPVIGQVNPHSIAYEGGLKPNQQIISVDNRKTLTWTSVMFHLLAHAGNRDHLKIEVKSTSDDKVQTHILDLSNWHIGKLTPDPLAGLGIIPYQPEIPLIIGLVSANSPAQSSNLHIGDKIIAINDKPIKKWQELITFVNQHPGETVSFKIERHGKQSTFPVTLGVQHSLLWQKTGFLGVGPKLHWPKDFLYKIQYSPLNAIPRAAEEITDFTYFNLLLFEKMITGKISLQSLGGPITIFQSAGDALHYGFLSFIGFLAFLSISIGIINLLPIPGLDGGHLFIYMIEFVIRRPIPVQILNFLFRLGFLLIIFVLIQALVNDLLRLY